MKKQKQTGEEVKLNKKFLITGGNGMVGKAFQRHLPTAFVLGGKADVDLTNAELTQQVFNAIKPEIVIHLAGKVGGVKANSENLGDFYTENIKINTNVLEAAKNVKVKRLVSFLSTCIYPENGKQPLEENYIHDGEPHSSNFGYAYAKRMLDVQSRAYYEQYGCDWLCVIPNNLYGPEDNFDWYIAHVIPALIRKIHKAKSEHPDSAKTSVVVSGDALVHREFTYVDDIVKIVFQLLNMDLLAQVPLNIGCTKEYLLRDVIQLLFKIMDYKGKIIYNEKDPKGIARKATCNDRLLNLTEVEYTSLEDGLRKTCDWFCRNYPNVRGCDV